MKGLMVLFWRMIYFVTFAYAAFTERPYLMAFFGVMLILDAIYEGAERSRMT